ncbi:hypothetical protein M432DRAFT_340225 [Thermoascus aurantiacus ATCC 26904]
MVDLSTPYIFDEDRYRAEVLLLPAGQTEEDVEQRLIEEARELGLKVPEIELPASLPPSMPSSPVVAARYSTERNSVCDVVSSGAASVDQLAASLSEATISSDNVARSGSVRSRTSFSTRPTSYSSTEGKPLPANERTPRKGVERSNSTRSASSPAAKERRRASLITAIGKIPFRKRRTSSTVLLSPTSQITVREGEGSVDKVYVEAKREDSHVVDSREQSETVRVEVPIFDEAASQRSLESPELREMYESHKRERSRHIVLENDVLNALRSRHRAAVTEKQLDNERVENEKREKNLADSIRLEERHLAAELDQLKEFEREKMNSRIRIKHMEGYVNNSSPPPTPELNGNPDVVQPVRKITRQQRERLAQEYHDRDSMDRLHEAKIKVLRDRQEKQFREAVARMERELQKLIEKNAQDLAELERRNQQEEHSVMQAFHAKKAKLKRRWNLEEAILRKKLELKNGLPYGPLPPLSFTDLHNETLIPEVHVADKGAADKGMSE